MGSSSLYRSVTKIRDNILSTDPPAAPPANQSRWVGEDGRWANAGSTYRPVNYWPTDQLNAPGRLTHTTHLTGWTEHIALSSLCTHNCWNCSLAM